MDVFFLLILLSCTVNAEITEVMYNPPSPLDDLANEYIELVFDEVISLENWVIEDSASNDFLVLIEGSGNSKINLIVTDNYSAYYFDNLNFDIVSVYSVGSRIGNGLNNGGDVVKIFDSNFDLVDEVSYDGSLAGDDGNALCFELDDVYACEPSPGEFVFEENLENGSSSENDYVEDFEKINSSEDGFIIIENVVVKDRTGCDFVSVELSVWNNRNHEEKILAFFDGFESVSEVVINPHKGQRISVPVASCDGELFREEGDYVLIVSGFGEKDMRVVRLGLVGDSEIFDEYEAYSVNLESNSIENNINGDSTRLKEDNGLDLIQELSVKKSENNLTVYLLYLVGCLVFCVFLKRI